MEIDKYLKRFSNPKLQSEIIRLNNEQKIRDLRCLTNIFVG